MQIDLFTPAGSKAKALDVPSSLFEAPINWGLMHQAVTMQQSNRRQSSAHVKTRGEVRGSTKKLFSQKHTGQARRGAVRSPLLRGGGKAFGPRNVRNFEKMMPRKMRHAALRSCLSLQASKGNVIALESYPETPKTKDFTSLLKKLPVEQGRRMLIITASTHKGVHLSSRNLPNVKTVTAGYLNPEDILLSRHVIFLADAITAVEKLFGKKEAAERKQKEPKEKAKKVPAAAKKAPAPARRSLGEGGKKKTTKKSPAPKK